MWLRGHSRSLKPVPFESLGAVSYLPSVVTMALSIAVCEIFSVKEWCDLENTVRVCSRLLRDIVTYWSKIWKFLYPTCTWLPRRG